MELYPNSVRSSILSSLFPPEVRMYNNLMSNFNNSLEFLFSACENDTNCNSKYPNLKSNFLSVYNSLKQNPITIKPNGDTYVLNQQEVLIFVHQILYNTLTIGQIPAFIKALKDRDTNSISRTVATYLPRLTLINLAVYYSVMKADEGTFNNAEKLKNDSNGLFLADSVLSFFSADPEVLKSWPNKKDKSNAMSVVKSNIPTFLISGNFDPIIPPSNAAILNTSLSNSQHLVFKNNGHVPIDGCFFNLAKQFLNDPTKKLDNSCSNSNTRIRWNSLEFTSMR
jgi:pimeloyl-ACP methyl ester carboxylesterase